MIDYFSNLSLRRIWVVVVHEMYLTKHSLELFFDIFFFPLSNVFLFGLISRYVFKNASNTSFLLLGVLLWEVVTIVQYNVTVSSMWEIWSHNLTNIFIAPISASEYLIAHIVSGIIKTLATSTVLAVTAGVLFKFNILNVGIINLAFFAINLTIFAIWIGIILLGFIFRFGTRMAAISWGLIFLFQPLTAAFFPVSVLPHWLQDIAHTLPPTYVFEDARKALSGAGILWSSSIMIFLANIVYLVFAAKIFNWFFKKSKESGQFARNDL